MSIKRKSKGETSKDEVALRQVKQGGKWAPSRAEHFVGSRGLLQLLAHHDCGARLGVSAEQQ